MSTLFLIGNVTSTGTTVESNKNEDFSTLLSALEDSTNKYCNLFQRKLILPDLDSLLWKIYSDRLLPLPNNWNYETGIALVVYHSEKILPQMNIRQMNHLFKQYFATLNICFIDISIMENSPNDYMNILHDIQDDLAITRNRVLKMNHWMNHSTTSCSSSVYSMMRQFNTYNDISNKDREPIPRVIRNIDFQRLLEEHNSLSNFEDEEKKYMELLSSWKFSALNLNTIELIKCGFYLIKRLSNFANVSITDNKLYLLLITIELSYHQINKFHNFRHCIDVMQACWQICEYIIPDAHMTKLLLALAATGHDIGHPGTNNSLFLNSNNELTQNKSILESFHYNIFSHILGNHWSKINSISTTGSIDNIIEKGILATDMSLHSTYVDILTQKKDKSEFTMTELISIIVKAADISNVTRPLTISAKWALLITLEFGDCALLQNFYKNENNPNDDINCFELLKTHPCKEHLTKADNIDMDTEIEIYELLNQVDFNVDNLLQKYPMIPNGQIFFIDTFAFEFFNKLSVVFPNLKFLVDAIVENKAYWVQKKQEQESSQN
ncbi:similar to Saccharomyces cerevisiae YOR360C PDE2 High-affinity cyclic AMP phosphodiesterase [Maudiozyma saulgeensis]|uniref:Phosphodiesterase n=1 Tax=Maudiozyma saulgeensis TaxID=1789683 RepID=A0A1X7R549_9SACH|nr:similar to Saccharomyces cerevisiae YOR360C PDE2 High-affinity cyclic AMP phosphodiesterase [Kazachstania saulgeensis]